MKAAVIQKPGTLHMEEVPVPELKEGEALIKVKYCGICGSDIHVFHGQHPTAEFPVIPGHEFVGEVIEVKGSGSEKFRRGDFVAAQPFYSCGNCEPCAKGHDNVCQELQFMGAHRNGGFAQYVKVLTRKMYKIPEGTDLRLAALIEPVAVAVHDVRRSGLRAGETALVIGGGPIGILIALIARHSGAGQVIISEISPYRRQFAEEMGFETADPANSDFEDKLDGWTAGRGFDVVYEVSGSKPGINTAVKYTKISGMIMVIGMAKDAWPVELCKVFTKELNIQGVRIHDQYNFIGALEILKSGSLNSQFEKLISRYYSLDELEEAFMFAEKPGDFFKVLVEVS